MTYGYQFKSCEIMKKAGLLILIFIINLSCMKNSELPTVKDINISKYLGKWYEIARLPNSFEKGLSCITATYTQRPDGKIGVVNSGYSAEKGKFQTANGKAKIPDSADPGRLKVSFFWIFYGDYYIIHVDSNYQYALVGTPSRKYLWILSRTPDIDKEIMDNLIETAKNYDFNTEKLIITEHNCSSK